MTADKSTSTPDNTSILLRDLTGITFRTNGAQSWTTGYERENFRPLHDPAVVMQTLSKTGVLTYGFHTKNSETLIAGHRFSVSHREVDKEKLAEFYRDSYMPLADQISDLTGVEASVDVAGASIAFKSERMSAQHMDVVLNVLADLKKNSLIVHPGVTVNGKNINPASAVPSEGGRLEFELPISFINKKGLDITHMLCTPRAEEIAQQMEAVTGFNYKVDAERGMLVTTNAVALFEKDNEDAQRRYQLLAALKHDKTIAAFKWSHDTNELEIKLSDINVKALNDTPSPYRQTVEGIEKGVRTIKIS